MISRTPTTGDKTCTLLSNFRLYLEGTWPEEIQPLFLSRKGRILGILPSTNHVRPSQNRVPMIQMPRRKNVQPTLSKLEPPMMANGSVVSVTASENSNGLMVPNIKDNGKIIGLTAKVNLLILMVTSMTANGRTIRQTDMVSIIT